VRCERRHQTDRIAMRDGVQLTCVEEPRAGEDEAGQRGIRNFLVTIQIGNCKNTMTVVGLVWTRRMKRLSCIMRMEVAFIVVVLGCVVARRSS
jgi:hypothetical protein